MRACCVEKGIIGCWQCDEFSNQDFRNCKKVNYIVNRIFSFFYKVDLPNSLSMLRNEGIEAYLEIKKGNGKM